MNIVKAMRAPLALAIVGVAVASVLNDNPPARILGFWAGVSMMLGFAINSAVATYQRRKRMGHSVRTVRSAIAILSSFTWCLIRTLVNLPIPSASRASPAGDSAA